MNADSCLIENFLQRVDNSILGNNSIVLPGKLLNFRTKNGGESVCSYDLDLHFYGPDPLAYKDKPSSIVESANSFQQREETKTVSDIFASHVSNKDVNNNSSRINFR